MPPNVPIRRGSGSLKAKMWDYLHLRPVDARSGIVLFDATAHTPSAA
ncbi:hypothetical protein [Corynebacterium pseudopelargi]|nr:hypothetical protein [Corynebacterium pseudopelargi]